MSNCAHCNKRFTCGCQKAAIGNGVIVCKIKAESNVPNQSTLNIELAKREISIKK